MEISLDADEILSVRKRRTGVILMWDLIEDNYQQLVIDGDDDEIMDLLRKIADLFNAEVSYRQDPDQEIVENIHDVFKMAQVSQDSQTDMDR